MGGKRVFTKDGKRVFIHRWQKSVYYLWVAKECVVYMGDKRVFYYIGWKRSFHHGRHLSFRPRRQKFWETKIREAMELQPPWVYPFRNVWSLTIAFYFNFLAFQTHRGVLLKQCGMRLVIEGGLYCIDLTIWCGL